MCDALKNSLVGICGVCHAMDGSHPNNMILISHYPDIDHTSVYPDDHRKAGQRRYPDPRRVIALRPFTSARFLSFEWALRICPIVTTPPSEWESWGVSSQTVPQTIDQFKNIWFYVTRK